MSIESLLSDALGGAFQYIFEKTLPILLIVFLVLLIASAMECFCGYKIFRAVSTMKGIALGLVIGVLFGMTSGNVVIVLCCAMLFGSIVGVMSYYLYALGIFNNCFFVGTLLMLLLTKNFGVAMLFGLLIGIVGCIFYKYMIIYLTGFMGGIGLGVSIGIWTKSTAAIIVLSIVCAVAGIFTQLSSKKENEEDNDSDKTSEEVEREEKKAITTDGILKNIQISENNKKTSTIFVAEIQSELQYVFPAEILKAIVQLPEFNEDGTWICSCGRKCKEERCILCGMTMSDAKEKLTFQYLEEHKNERISAILKEREEQQRQLEEAENKRKEERKEKVDAFLNTTKDSIQNAEKEGKEKIVAFSNYGQKKLESIKLYCKDNKKKVFTIGSICIVLVGAVIGITQIPVVKTSYYNMRGENSTDVYEKRSFFEKSIAVEENAAAYIGLLKMAIEKEMYEQTDYYIGILEEKFENDEKYLEIKKQYKPAIPACNLEDGAYDIWQNIEYVINDDLRIMYQINDSEYLEYETSICLDENGEYIIRAYAIDKYGFKSDVVESKYEINVIAPDMVVSNYESGVYEDTVYVELVQPQGYQIFYTKDGTQPDENSYAYENGIQCSRGVSRIRACAFDEKGISSNILELDVIVRAPIQGCNDSINSTRESESGYEYDYLATSEGLKKYDVSGNLLEVISTDGCHSLFFKDGILYYVSHQNGIMAYNESTGEMANIAKDCPCSMVVVQDKIYYVNQGEPLQYMDLDGTRYECKSDFMVAAMDVYNGQLFMADNVNKIYRMEDDGSYTEICQLPVSLINSIAVCSDSIYATGEGNVYRYYLGELTEIMQGTYETYSREPKGMTNGYNSSTSVGYTNLYINHNRLYCTMYKSITSYEINWLTKDEKNRNYTYESTDMIYSLDSETSTRCEETNAFVVDGGYFSYGDDENVVHKVSY